MESTRNDHPVAMLLAGFSAFPGAPINPSEDLVRTFDAAALRSGIRLSRLVLPVKWSRSWQVLRAEIERRQPAVVLLVGLHGAAARFRIEMKAHNERRTDRADSAGRRAETALIAEGPDHVESRLPVEALARSLRAADIDFEFSEDAGRYLCNETLFHLCLNGAVLGLRSFGFIHTPLTHECAALMGLDDEGRELQRRTVPAASLRRMTAAVFDCLAETLGDAKPDVDATPSAA